MAQKIPSDRELAELRAPSLVAWLVANTEHLVSVAGALENRAGELSPGVSRARVVELCKTVRHAGLEITVALLALLSQDPKPVDDLILESGMPASRVSGALLTLELKDVARRLPGNAYIRVSV